jgi:three-Cys-motif partner protein
MARDLHRKPFNEGTLVKLELFRAYITAWLAVFVGSQRVTKKKIRIFDLFCGPGEDAAGQKGSPVLILEILQSLSAQIRAVGYEVEVYFNDADAAKVEELKQALSDRKLLTGPYKLHFSSQDFFEIFDGLYPKMLDSANLLLLDQHGVRFFTADVFKRIRTLPVTDTLVFMSASYVSRFKDEPEISQYLETKKIFADHTPYHQVHRALVEYYRSLVPSSEQYFLAPFSLKSGSNIYGVIFGSRNHKGLQKFLETAWSFDPLRGEADYDIDREGLVAGQGMLFDEMSKPKKTQLFEQQFETEILAGRLTDTAAIYDFVHQQGFLMKHANPVIRRLKTEQRIDGNLTSIGYDSLKQPQPIRVI